MVGIVCRKTPEGIIVQIERTEGPVFTTKGAAEQQGLALCREWVDQQMSWEEMPLCRIVLFPITEAQIGAVFVTMALSLLGIARSFLIATTGPKQGEAFSTLVLHKLLTVLSRKTKQAQVEVLPTFRAPNFRLSTARFGRIILSFKVVVLPAAEA